MPYSIVDLIVDLILGASEIFFGKRKGRADEDVKKPDEAEKSVVKNPYRRPQL